MRFPQAISAQAGKGIIVALLLPIARAWAWSAGRPLQGRVSDCRHQHEFLYLKAQPAPMQRESPLIDKAPGNESGRPFRGWPVVRRERSGLTAYSVLRAPSCWRRSSLAPRGRG